MNSKFLLGALIIFACGQSLAGELPSGVAESKRIDAQIPEEDVSIGTIQQLFKNAYMKTSLDEDGDLWVEVEQNFKVMIAIDSSRKLIHYRLLFSFKKAAADSKKLVLANNMNSAVIMARFSVRESDASTLVVDYFLPFENEIPAFQIVSALRLLSSVSMQAVRTYDKEDLIE